MLKSLWTQPIIYPSHYLAKNPMGIDQWQHVTSLFMSKGLIELRKVQFPQGGYIFDCPAITQCYQDIEQLIFDLENTSDYVTPSSSTIKKEERCQ